MNDIIFYIYILIHFKFIYIIKIIELS